MAGEAEEAFFQDRIMTVPERQGKADVLVTVTEAGEPVFIPTVGA